MQKLKSGSMTVTRIVPVQNSLSSAFLNTHDSEGSSQANNPFLRVSTPEDADSKAALKKLKDEFADSGRNPGEAHIVFAWHGCDASVLEDVCRDGPRCFRSTDAGYFGAGSYFALEAEYAARYSQFKNPNAHGEYGVILFALSVSQVLPITLDNHYRTLEQEKSIPPDQHGKSIFCVDRTSPSPGMLPGYDAYFVPVRFCGRQHPVDNSMRLPHDVDYQACPASQAEGHEIVLASHHRCTPVAIVYFK
jgi:hypothetical protein